MTKSRTFCVLPWNHISLESANLDYKMCCVTYDIIPDGYSALTSSPEEALTSTYMNKVRQAMLNGDEVKACQVCYNEEKNSSHSMRTFYLEAVGDHAYDLMKLTDENGVFKNQPTIEHLEIRLGNLCNLKCVMCSPLNSSSYDDYEEIFGVKTKNTTPVKEIRNKDLNRLLPVLEQVKQLTFRGGEPLINRRNEEILDHLIRSERAGEVHLTYTTNGTSIPERLKEDWKKFKKVTLWVSVDGVGELNNFIRYGSRWELIEANLQKIDSWANEIPQLCWGITSTLQAYNLHQLPDLINLSAKFETCYPYPFINSLDEPSQFMLENLAVDKLRRAAEEICITVKNVVFPYESNPLTRRLLEYKRLPEAQKRNLAAIMGLVGHLEKCPGGDKSATRSLMEITDRIMKSRNITDVKFLKRVF